MKKGLVIGASVAAVGSHPYNSSCTGLVHQK